MNGVETTASEITHQTKNVHSNFVLYGVRNVFNILYVQKPSVPVKVLCVEMENTFHHPSQSLFGSEIVCEEEIGSNEEFSGAGLACT
jgi:hypothetical protein